MSEIWLDTHSWFYKPGVGNLWQERFKGKRFDSYLGKNSHYTQNHALYLLLRIYLNPVGKRSTAVDLNKKSFPIKDWTPSGWAKFKEEFEKQSRLWNNRFWLIPPAHFSLMDNRDGGRVLRPNIACHVLTTLTDSPATAHRTIDAINVDADEVKRRDDIDDDNPLLGSFRSDDRHIASTAMNTGRRVYEDDNGDTYTIEHHYTIAHEIRHAMGLSHIGIMKHTEKCEMALKFKKDKTNPRDIPFDQRGGGNAPVCYGKYDKAGMAENIMGKGYKFEAINAEPWTKRLAMHTNTLASDWVVTLTALHPLPVSEKDRHASDRRKWIAM